jgi:hypothetical protein
MMQAMRFAAWPFLLALAAGCQKAVASDLPVVHRITTGEMA